MANYSFKLPDVGEGIVEVELTQWMISEGEEIAIDQAIADVMTDKANVEITSPVAGKILNVACEAGDILAVGAELILVELTNDSTQADGENPADSKSEPVENTLISAACVANMSETSESPVEPAAPPPTPAPSSKTEATKPPNVTPKTNVNIPTANRENQGKALASPAVRRRAREAEVELDSIASSDSNGRITHQDLDAHVASMGQLAIGGIRKVRTGTKSIAIKGLRRVIAKKMQTAKRSIPHYSYVEEIDLTELESLRAHLNANRSENHTKLTPLPFLMLAMVRAVRKFPECNAHFDDNSNIVTQYDGVHIGMATMTDEGLKVPVLHHVEAMDIWHCASEIKRLAAAARENNIALAELSGSTITLTSLGAMGGIASTPIINHPEVSIIGVNKALERVVVRDGEMEIRTMMNLSSSFDHRIVDGYAGATLVQEIKSLLEHPATLFM